MSNPDLYKPKDFDYDYLVEEFAAEYKLDTSRLRELYDEYTDPSTPASSKSIIEAEWMHLWPEFHTYSQSISSFDIATLNKKTTELVKGYYLQSPKDSRTNPIVHYSLQEIMLAKLQDERNKNKRLMGQAFKAGDIDSGKRFNAMQLALKVNMNSTYGASGNANFAHYDPDIAATITWCSRQCIGQLTETLECDYAYVDKEFLEDSYIKSQLAVIEKLNLLKIRKATTEEISTMPRRRALRRLYTDSYEVDKTKQIYKIEKVRCEVVYQDTDSNYFECPAVQEYYLGCWAHDKKLSDAEHDAKFHASPDLIYQMMCSMVSLDNFLCQLTVKIIDRNPIGLGFEGSFVVCRYLNRKKKYYGVKAADDDGNVFGPDLLVLDENHKKIKDPRAYDSDGQLKSNYGEFWKPKEKCLPMPDGTFVQIDNNKLIHERVNYLDYINSMGVKVTGVDLTRRDQYKFINYCHLQILRMDLRICGFDPETREWHGISLRTGIADVIDGVIENFRKTYKQFVKIANFETGDLPSEDFMIEDFSKNGKNNGKKNDVYWIIDRYKNEINSIDQKLEANRKIENNNKNNDRNKNENNSDVSDVSISERLTSERLTEEEIANLKYRKTILEECIPYVGDRMFYVVLGNAETEAHTAKGVKSILQLKNLRVSLRELDSIIADEKGMTREWFNEQNKPSNLTYEVWLNAKKISMLYLKHYISALAKALVLYRIGEAFPEEAKRIDEGMYTDKEKGEIVTKLQEKLAATIVERYFPSNRSAKMKKLNLDKTIEKQPSRNQMRDKENKIQEIAAKTFSNYRPEISNAKLVGTVRTQLRIQRAIVEAWDGICRRILTNKFVNPRYERGSTEFKLYEKIKNSDNRFAAATERLEFHLEKLKNLAILSKLLDIDEE